jgi:hypothetical protein
MRDRLLREAGRERDLERHRREVARHDGAQDRRVDALALGHVDRELGARPAILRHDGDDPGRVERRRRNVLAVAAQPHDPAQRHEGARIRLDQLVHVARVVGPGALEGGDLPPEEPSDHCSSPVSRW